MVLEQVVIITQILKQNSHHGQNQLITDGTQNLILPNDGYYRLAYAVVEKAVYDYKKALSQLSIGKNKRKNEEIVEECERFFNSEYIKLFTDLEINKIIRE